MQDTLKSLREQFILGDDAAGLVLSDYLEEGGNLTQAQWVRGQREKKAPLPTKVRWMIRRDLPEVLANERGAHGHAAWTEEDFLYHLRKRNCIGMVAEEWDDSWTDGTVCGHVVYELHSKHFHILNLTVGPGYQAQGVGRRIIDRMKGKLDAHRRRRITIDVREGNLPAQLFLKRVGLACTEVDGAFYHDTGEGAYRFKWTLKDKEQSTS